MGVYRSNKSLNDRMINHRLIGKFSVDIQVFADAVKHNDRIMNRETNHSQEVRLGRVNQPPNGKSGQ